MSDSTPRPAPEDRPAVANLELKAAVLLLALLVLVAASAVYLLYARGSFERTQELTLITDDAEGVAAGMDMTFSGFPIGRVRRVELAETGNVRIVVDVPVDDAHWLRETSVFVLARGLVGDTRLRAYSGVLTDPPLPPGAVRSVLRGDASAEIPKLVAAARELVANLSALTGPGSAMAQSLANVKAATDKLNGPRGALGLAFGNDQDARQLVTTLERTNALLARVDGLVAKADGLVARADAQVFGPEGIMRDAQASVVQLRAVLQTSRDLLQAANQSLRKVDAVLDEARAIAGNVRGATTDLDALRADVEASLRRIDQLINEVNRKWPFKRDPEIKLP